MKRHAFLLVNLTALLLAVCGKGLGQESELTKNDVVEYLRAYSERSYGQQFDFKTRRVSGSVSGIFGHFWLSKDGSRFRNEQTIESVSADGNKRTTVFRTYFSTEQLNVIESITANGKSRLNVSAIKVPGNSLSIGPCQYLLGYDQSTGKFWHEIFADDDNDFALEITDGQLTASLDRANLGVYEFQFVVKKQGLELSGFSIRKRTGDVAILFNEKHHKYGEEGQFKHQLQRTTVLTKMSFDENEMVKSYRLSTTVEGERGTHNHEIVFLQTNCKALDNDLPENIDFGAYTIPNGTPVRIPGNRDSKLEFHDGKIIETDK